MKPLFTPEMFKPISGWMSQVIVSEYANKIFTEWLQSQVVVYGWLDSENESGIWTTSESQGDTHTARLVCVEELKREPCRHEPSDTSFTISPLSLSGFCNKCGVKLKAQWFPADVAASKEQQE